MHVPVDIMVRFKELVFQQFSDEQISIYKITPDFRGYTASLTRLTHRQSGGPIRGAEADIKAAGRNIYGARIDALVQLLHSRGRLTESFLLKSNRFPRSECGPGGFLAGSTNLNPAAECPLTPIEISFILERRRRRGWCPVPVQSAGLSHSRSHAFLSLPQQSRPINPPARPYTGRYHRPDRWLHPTWRSLWYWRWARTTGASATFAIAWSPASSPRRRGSYGSRGGQHRCSSQRTETTSLRTSKRCSVPTGPRCPSETSSNVHTSLAVLPSTANFKSHFLN